MNQIENTFLDWLRKISQPHSTKEIYLPDVIRIIVRNFVGEHTLRKHLYEASSGEVGRGR